MLGEFCRVVTEAAPDWWLLENVPGAPSIDVTGYSHQRIDIDARDLGGATVTASREPAVS
jgi:DNA (cytosine-5)-methyltransferase 1